MKKQFLIIHKEHQHILNIWYFFADDFASVAHQIVNNMERHKEMLVAMRGLAWDCDSRHFRQPTAFDFLEFLEFKLGQTRYFFFYELPLDQPESYTGEYFSFTANEILPAPNLEFA